METLCSIIKKILECGGKKSKSREALAQTINSLLMTMNLSVPSGCDNTSIAHIGNYYIESSIHGRAAVSMP